MWETWVQSQGWEGPLVKGMATHSSILAWRISWMEEPGGLQYMGLLRLGYDGDLSLPLGLALGSPIFPSGCEGKLGVALESLQGLPRPLGLCLSLLLALGAPHGRRGGRRPDSASPGLAWVALSENLWIRVGGCGGVGRTGPPCQGMFVSAAGTE